MEKSINVIQFISILKLYSKSRIHGILNFVKHTNVIDNLNNIFGENSQKRKYI